MSTSKKGGYCLRCDRPYYGFPALSRWDNWTDICSPCSVEEVMIDAGLIQPGRSASEDAALARSKRFTALLERREDER